MLLFSFPLFFFISVKKYIAISWTVALHLEDVKNEENVEDKMMKLFETITSQLCKMLVEVLLRGATPMGFPVRIAAPCSGPDLFV